MHYSKSILSLFICASLVSCSTKVERPLEIEFASQKIVDAGSFGLKTTLRNWDETSSVKVSGPTKIVDDYEMKVGKRLHCHNEAQEYVYTLTNADGENLFVELREYPDGFAFRYRLPNVQDGEQLIDEATSYKVPEGANRWIPGFAHDANYEQLFH